MIRRIGCIALLSSLLSPGLVRAESPRIEQFQELFVEEGARQALDRPALEAELDKLLAQLNISDEDKEALSQAILTLVDKVTSGDIQASYEAAQSLEQLVKDLQAKYQKETERGIFGTAKAVWNIVSAIREGDNWGVVKGLWDLVWSLID